MGISVMLWGAENLVPAEYWCPYSMYVYVFFFSFQGSDSIGLGSKSLFAPSYFYSVYCIRGYFCGGFNSVNFANISTSIYVYLL